MEPKSAKQKQQQQPKRRRRRTSANRSPWSSSLQPAVSLLGPRGAKHKFSELPVAILCQCFIGISGHELCGSMTLVCKHWSVVISKSAELWKMMAHVKHFGRLGVRLKESHVFEDAFNCFIETRKQQNTTRKRRRDRSIAAQATKDARVNLPLSKQINLVPSPRVTGCGESLRAIPDWKAFYFSTPHRATLLEPWLVDTEQPNEDIPWFCGSSQDEKRHHTTPRTTTPTATSPVSNNSNRNSTAGGVDSNTEHAGRNRIQDLIACLRDVWIEYDRIHREGKHKIELSFIEPKPHHVLVSIPSPEPFWWLSAPGPNLNEITIETSGTLRSSSCLSYAEEKSNFTQESSLMSPLYLIGYGDSLGDYVRLVHNLRMAARRRYVQLRQRGSIKEAFDNFISELPARTSIRLTSNSTSAFDGSPSVGGNAIGYGNEVHQRQRRGTSQACESGRYRCFLTNLLNHLVRMGSSRENSQTSSDRKDNSNDPVGLSCPRARHHRTLRTFDGMRANLTAMINDPSLRDATNRREGPVWRGRDRVLPMRAPGLVQQVLQEIDRSSAAQHRRFYASLLAHPPALDEDSQISWGL